MKGCQAEPQQPQLPRARALATKAEAYVVIADASNIVPRLNCSLPIAIESDGWEDTAEELDDMFLGDGEIWRRPAEGTANPR